MLQGLQMLLEPDSSGRFSSLSSLGLGLAQLFGDRDEDSQVIDSS